MHVCVCGYMCGWEKTGLRSVSWAECWSLWDVADKTAMGYYRALLKSGEVSQRALDLTTEIIAYNPGHYSVW